MSHNVPPLLIPTDAAKGDFMMIQALPQRGVVLGDTPLQEGCSHELFADPWWGTEYRSASEPVRRSA